MVHINIHYGDCQTLFPTLDEGSVDCVITSPPYAEQRKNQYGGISEEEYPQWTVKYMNEIKRLLKPGGSVAIVIRPHVRGGQISDYTLRTRLSLREAGWYECEELIWIKPSAPPMGHVGRPRRSWESIHWFSLSGSPFCDPKANGQPSSRLGLQTNKGLGSYIHEKEQKLREPGTARCRDYVEIGTSRVNRDKENNHPAQYPEDLSSWLIRLLCPPGGTVLDPFLGGGTTAVSAINEGRDFIGIELSTEYKSIIDKRVNLALSSIER